MKKKAILFLFVLVVCFFVIEKRVKIHRYFFEQRYYSIFEKINLVEHCYKPYVEKIEIFHQEGVDYIAQNEIAVNKSIEKMNNFFNHHHAKKFSIPKVTHQIYFSKEDRKEPIGEFFVEKLKANFSRLNKVANYKHIIWTNNLNIFPDELTKIKNVEVRNLQEFAQDELYPYLIQLIKDGQNYVTFFSPASDLLRYMVIAKFGGIYNDMDYEIYDALTLNELIEEFDFIGVREHNTELSYYGTSFFAAKPGHPITLEAIKLLKRNLKHQNTPDYITYSCTSYDEIYFNAPPLITTAFLKAHSLDENNDVVLPPWMLLNLSFAREKNNGCAYLKKKASEFISDENTVNNMIKNYTKNLFDEKLMKHFETDLRNAKLPKYQNIYYNLDYRNQYPVIGADMGCGTWVGAYYRRNWYWK